MGDGEHPQPMLETVTTVRRAEKRVSEKSAKELLDLSFFGRASWDWQMNIGRSLRSPKPICRSHCALAQERFLVPTFFSAHPPTAEKQWYVILLLTME